MRKKYFIQETCKTIKVSIVLYPNYKNVNQKQNITRSSGADI